MNDERIGQLTATSVQFPARTLSGRAVERPATTRSLGGGFFVVVDRNPTVDVEAEIAALRAALEPEAVELPLDEEGEAIESETGGA